jgi:O-acetyl-ADP-ribose deacetylase (regulator of RNase III)
MLLPPWVTHRLWPQHHNYIPTLGAYAASPHFSGLLHGRTAHGSIVLFYLMATVMMVDIQLTDIVTLEKDAIVNAANTTLLGGGGVDGAIHLAAGPELLVECRQLRGCPVGQARITRAYQLPAKYVIHTVGPVWQGGHRDEAYHLANCYRACFTLLREHRLESVAFPAISTGAFGYPLEAATRIAICETLAFLAHNPAVDVTFACFDKTAEKAYRVALNAAKKL